MVKIPRTRNVPRPGFAGLAPVEAAAAPPEPEELPAPAAPAVEVAMEAPHIDDVPEPGYMGRPDGTLLPRRNRRLRAPRNPSIPQWIRSRKIWRFSHMVVLAHEGADFSRVWTLQARWPSVQAASSPVPPWVRTEARWWRAPSALPSGGSEAV